MDSRPRRSGNAGGRTDNASSNCADRSGYKRENKLDIRRDREVHGVPFQLQFGELTQWTA